MESNKQPRSLAIGGTIIFALSLSACGGGSGGGVNSTPAPPPPPPIAAPPPPPPPTPPPPPPPTTTNFNTAEFRRSDGPSFHNATSAYTAGATGQGVIVGVIDSGIDASSHEFAGRISSQSFDATGAGRALGDDDGHGTAVSRVIAAAKDDRDVHGIAFNATILTLRADQANSCTVPAAGENEASCSFFDSAIAAGLNRAVDAGARVVNISLGGAGGATQQLRSAINRATQAGIVIVVSAGNEANDTPPDYDPDNPSPFAQALVANGNGLVIVSTSVDNQGIISNFSNRAGASQNTVLSALGEGICCEYESDSIKTTVTGNQTFVSVFNGTSFSAPQISGAAALLAQAFPNLTGAQIVNLLLTSARDAGDTGTDAIYGRGILDIARAFAPAGTTSLAGSQTLVALNDNAGTLSGPMGDAGTISRPVNAVILDSYGRAYDTDLAYGLASSTQRLRLTNAIVRGGRAVSINQGTTELAFSLSEDGNGGADLSPLALNGGEQQAARVLAGRITASIAKDTRFSLGIRQAVAGQVLALQNMHDGAFLTAGNAKLDGGFDRQPSSAFAVRHTLNGFGITASAEAGKAQLFERATDTFIRPRYNDYRYNMVGLAIDREWGPLRLALGANWINEDQTILGARLASTFGQNGAQSLFLDAGGQADLGNGFLVTANWRQGWTKPNQSSIISKDSQLQSNAFSFDVSKSGIIGTADRLALRVSQPLRVTSGGLALNLPVAYDYATLSPTYGIQQLNLAPQGREIASELAWTLPINGGYFSSNLYWRNQPGHFRNAPDDIGLAFRFNLDF